MMPPTPSSADHDLVHRQVEAVCEQFENEWMAGRVPEIRNFLHAVTSENQGDVAALLEELIRIDLDHRWKRAKDSAPPAAQHSTERSELGDTVTFQGSFPNCPELEDYIEHFPELGPLGDLSVELVVEEYRVRHRWGDRPSRSAFLRRFSHHGIKLTNALAEIERQFSSFAGLEVRVYHGQQLASAGTFDGTVELGRQQVGEAAPFCRTRTTNGWRLVIASLHDDSVSRQHVRLELLDPQQLLVTNLSSTRSVRFEGGRKIAANDTRVVVPPVLLLLGNLAIRIQHG